MDYKTLSYPEYCGMLYTEEYKKTLDVEAGKSEKMPQGAFMSCSHRAKALSFMAEKRVDRFAALTVLFHRKGEHGEKYDEEETTLMAAAPESDIEAAQYYARSWWLG